MDKNRQVELEESVLATFRRWWERCEYQMPQSYLYQELDLCPPSLGATLDRLVAQGAISLVRVPLQPDFPDVGWP